MDRILTLTAITIFHTITVVLIASVIVYGIFAEWRTSEVGRHVMAYTTVFAVTFLYASISFFIPELSLRNRPAAATLLYGGILYVVSKQLYLILKYQLQARRDKDGSD